MSGTRAISSYSTRVLRHACICIEKSCSLLQLPSRYDTSRPPPSIILIHQLVPFHIRRKVTLHARLPVRHLERRRVAPRLQRELLLDDAGKVLRPALARELRCGRFDELGVDEVCAAATTAKERHQYTRVTHGRSQKISHCPALSRTKCRVNSQGPHYLYRRDLPRIVAS